MTDTRSSNTMVSMGTQSSDAKCPDVVREIAVGMADKPGALLPILHAG